jgi:hypothetical protein
VAFYADKDYTEDQAVLDAMNAVMQGNLSLHWFDALTEKVKVQPRDARRGLVYQDLDIGSYGYSDIPESVRTSQSMAARGSEKWGKLPDMGYLVNRKSDVWSDNVVALYEESKARRWAPALSVPWTELDADRLAPEVAAACVQLYTFLQECVAVALDFPSRWVALINQEFIEQKSFMCSQMLDCARLLEAFRKRALYGGGLGRANVAAEQGLKQWLWADEFSRGSLVINLILGGFLLALYRHIAAFAPTRVDRAIMGFAMQDAGRHAAYGTGALRYHLVHQAEERATLDAWLDGEEHVILALLGSPELIEPLIIVSGGGLEAGQLHRGREAALKFIRLVAREYFERLESAGLCGRAVRSRLSAIISRIRI